jgi:FAD dependent oxidoreductase
MNVPSRRSFLGQAAAGGVAALSSSQLAASSSGREQKALSPDAASYDVAVFGGGPAGIVAATQAARAGAETLLVEKNGMLGGTTTSAGVNFPGLFHAWGKQIIAGIGWELVNRCADTCGQILPDFSAAPDRHWKHQVRVDRAVYAALADELVIEAGVNVLFHAMPAAFEERTGKRLITVCTKTGLQKIQAKVLIDCTGDANVLALAGCEMVTHDTLQPGTLMLRLSGYDLSAIDKDALRSACAQALANGGLRTTDCASGPDTPWRLLASHGDNSLDVLNIDGRTSEGRTAAELAGRGAFLRLYRFLRSQPGLSGLKVDFMAPECGIRETVTIKGKAAITVDDYVSGRVWPDAVCNSFYPIDWHRASGRGIDQRHLKPGTVATIPRRALLPAGKSNLIAAGRCIASDQLANSALRVQATCMAVGQAAGAMAALGAASNVEVAEVSMDALRALLSKHGAIVPQASA